MQQVSDFYDKPWSQLIDWYLSPASGGKEPTPRNGVINGAWVAQGFGLIKRQGAGTVACHVARSTRVHPEAHRHVARTCDAFSAHVGGLVIARLVGWLPNMFIS